MCIILQSYETILPIWTTKLWPNRTSKIEANSAMTLNRTYDMANMEAHPTFFSWVEDGAIVGINSGHRCGDNSYRSRGLWVNPAYRRKGIGVQLLLATIEQAKSEHCVVAWSYPKLESWRTYEKAGFILASGWEESELGQNAYCTLYIV